MIENFSVAIGQVWLVKQEMMKLDKRNVWPYHMPEVAATDTQIFQAEIILGHSIDPRYKAFLKCANGWPAFYQSVDLFGTEDLIGGPRNEYGESQVSYLDDNLLKKGGFSRKDFFPIAATRSDRDLFVITRPSSMAPGIVIWFAGEEIDRFSNFDEFFLAMLEYNREELLDFQKAK